MTAYLAALAGVLLFAGVVVPLSRRHYRLAVGIVVTFGLAVSLVLVGAIVSYEPSCVGFGCPTA